MFKTGTVDLPWVSPRRLLEGNHSVPCDAEVGIDWSCTSTPKCCVTELTETNLPVLCIVTAGVFVKVPYISDIPVELNTVRICKTGLLVHSMHHSLFPAFRC